MKGIRFWLALWIGKTVGILMKMTGRKGTTFPGLLASKLNPYVVNQLGMSFARGTVIITGTNGKTTSNNLLAAILRSAGIRVAFNREGANMITGIAGALLQNTSFGGKPLADILLLEVDEATVPVLCRDIRPRMAVVTNFFRDQLDRYGELDTTVRLVKEALPEQTELILNADDPLVTRMGIGREHVYYYGVKSLPGSAQTSDETREGKYCALCGEELSYELFHYGQLGLYYCRGCGFRRPEPDLTADDINTRTDGIQFSVLAKDLRDNEQEFFLPLQGYYNLYNGLAAFCSAMRLGIDPGDIRKGLAGFVSDAGRMENFVLNGKRATLTLVKNPMGFNQVIQTLIHLNQDLRLLIAINDLAADGRDISWLWDVDFEAFGNTQKIRQIICSGLRAEDMALRLKYAGLPESMIEIEHAAELAVRKLEMRTEPDEALFILPTYTMLFPLRDILARDQASAGTRKEAAAG
ncbi:domain of unknown function DUF1727 [Syntrophobotulus glycolicus DSM 8271]|uniref:Lipid II isoglutaminyl synthase (glutamine-hydrolyzing) subunit MurT n=1 Tax=Syntrophobotulus glycolicus (strain DSM 8271 / FlGlyR) TaxID=645991 RepID=F0SXB0_SYNGF|nr:Mur ligase family protein [Syntrophobotulus glycolicus]ADY56970.1 domain of unknown function DUF1727 [Syntrophobotulus glycolicus DSM 8271]